MLHALRQRKGSVQAIMPVNDETYICDIGHKHMKECEGVVSLLFALYNSNDFELVLSPLEHTIEAYLIATCKEPLVVQTFIFRKQH